MTKTITFNELRDIKDRIAAELGLSVETVRNYFGGENYKEGKSCGVHIESGPNGGIVVLSDTTILDRALDILGANPLSEV